MQRFDIKFELYGFTCTRQVEAKDFATARQQAQVIEKHLKSKGVPISPVTVVTVLSFHALPNSGKIES